MKLKILTYNIHKGFSTGNSYALHRVRDALYELNPDLIFLQEVIGENRRHQDRVKDWPKSDQAQFIAENIFTHSIYGKNAVYEDGHHGNAILSQHPVKQWRNYDISINRFERRGVLHAAVDIGGLHNLHLMCLHIDLLEGNRLKQMDHLVRLINSEVPEHEPLIVAGDFNDWTRSAEEYLLEKVHLHEAHCLHQGRPARTFPAFWPLLPLDRIYVRGFDVLSCEVLQAQPWPKFSDHLPVTAELFIKGNK